MQTAWELELDRTDTFTNRRTNFGTSLLARDLPSVYNGEHAKRQR
jgi:hypothetical protein